MKSDIVLVHNGKRMPKGTTVSDILDERTRY